MKADDSADSLTFVQRHAEQLKKGATLRYYTEPRLMSVQARAAFIPPDVTPLP